MKPNFNLCTFGSIKGSHASHTPRRTCLHTQTCTETQTYHAGCREHETLSIATKPTHSHTNKEAYHLYRENSIIFHEYELHKRRQMGKIKLLALNQVPVALLTHRCGNAKQQHTQQSNPEGHRQGQTDRPAQRGRQTNRDRQTLVR